MILIPRFGHDGNLPPMSCTYLTMAGWVTAVDCHRTIEFSADCWRAHLEAVFEAAEGKTVAALERLKEG